MLSCKSHKSDDYNIFLADPTILLDNGKYYLYGSTAGGIDSTNNGFLVYESNDLLVWKRKGYALVKGDAYGDKGFWGPQVFKKGNLYYMVYVANENIALASSISPVGPFENKLKTHYISSGKQLDPFIFFDDGIWYLFHVRRLEKGNEIYVVQLQDDLKTFKEETLTKCMSADLSWEDNDDFDLKSVQGPSVIKAKGVYYMIYSVNNFRSPKYAVGYAKSSSPMGPWHKAQDKPLIDLNTIDQNGPGHGDIFFDSAKGIYRYVLHTHFSKSRLRPRKTGMVDLSLNQDKKTIVLNDGTFRFLKIKKPTN
jgi:beta-xylosidase